MASSSSGEAGPSRDALASIITQVSPNSQPARAPLRSPRGAPRGTKKASSTRVPQAARTGQSPTSPTASTTAQDVELTERNTPASATVPTLLSAEVDNGATTDDAKGSHASLATTDESHAKTPADGLNTLPVASSTGQGQGPSDTVRTTATDSTATAQPLTANAGAGSTNATLTNASAAAGATDRQGNAQASTSALIDHNASGTRKKKKKGFFGSLFSSCFGDSSYDEEEQPLNEKRSADGPKMTERRGTAPVSTNAPQGLANKASASALTKQPISSATGSSTLSADPSAATSAAAAGAVAVGALAAGALATTNGKTSLSPEIIAASSKGGATLSLEETEGVLSGAVQAPGSEAQLTPSKKHRRRSGGEASSAHLTPSGSKADLTGVTAADIESESGDEVAEESEEEYMDEDERIVAQGGAGIPLDEDGNPRPLLVELTPSDHGRKCLVLDLDETLVHSSFKFIHAPDFIVPVEIENQVHNVYVIKRPGVDAFMKRMGEIYEVVIFTASLSKYADPVLDHLDIHHVVKHRLFRESCYNHKGNYVKDLSQLGRPIGDTIIIDNSPASYIFHPNNAVPVSSWFNDPHDTELTDLQSFLADLANVPDVRGVLDAGLYPVGTMQSL